MDVEKLQAKVLELEDQVKVLKATNETLTKDNTGLQDRNKSLVEHNAMLFARVGNPVKKEKNDKDDDIEVMSIDDVADLFK